LNVQSQGLTPLKFGLVCKKTDDFTSLSSFSRG
jgi:hypothetical protein